MESIWNQNVVPTPSRFIIAVYFAFGSYFARFLLDRYLFQISLMCVIHRILIPYDCQLQRAVAYSLTTLGTFELLMFADYGYKQKQILSLLKTVYFIVRGLSVWLMSKTGTPLKINKATRAKISKITESMWKLTYYATLEFCVLSITYREPWFTDITAYFRDFKNQELKFSLELVYMCQCGFYIYSIAALLLWETRRKDFSVMMSHHIITVFLIGYSYITRFFRIGSVVLAIHDASDVFLEGAKILKYSGKELGASVMFGLFAVSWLILRLIIFPFWVIRATSINLLDALRPSESYDMMMYYVFNALLLNLLVFHIYWWILIFNMIMRQLKNRGELGEDIRSDSDDDN